MSQLSHIIKSLNNEQHDRVREEIDEKRLLAHQRRPKTQRRLIPICGVKCSEVVKVLSLSYMLVQYYFPPFVSCCVCKACKC